MWLMNEIPDMPAAWSRWLLRHGSGVIWDTETTGLEEDARLVSIGIIDLKGNTLVDTLINPLIPIPPEATEIHGVTDAMVKDAPTFPEVYPQIRAALLNEIWVVYNLDFDEKRLWWECHRHALLFPGSATMQGQSMEAWDWAAAFCAMKRYAAFWGDWNRHYENYRWQKLEVAARQQRLPPRRAHHALADALRTLDLIRALAYKEEPAHLTNSSDYEENE